MNTRNSRSPSHRARGRWLWNLSVSNAVFIALLFVAQTFTSEYLWLLALALFLPQQIYLVGTVILLVLAAAMKLRRSAVVNALVFFFSIYALLNFNLAVPQASGSEKLRVMSYNIRFGSRGVRNVSEVIKSQRPEIVILQEVLAKNGWPDPWPQLKELLPEYSVSRSGQLVTLSRLPIQRSRAHPLPASNSCGILETHLLLRGKTVRVFNAHFLNPIDGPVSEWPLEIKKRAPIREQQLELLTSKVKGQDGPHIIAGDFNAPPRGRLNRKLLNLGTDAHSAGGIGFGYTFPAAYPVMRIDRIITSEHLQIARFRTLNARASDHRPLVADYVLDWTQ